MTLVIRVDPGATQAEAVEPAAEVLLEGGVAAGPTQTFYGLMAAADRPEALARIVKMKGREARKPLLLLLDDIRRVEDYADRWPDTADLLAEAFWPGPLTLLVKARPGLPPALVGPDGTVGLRVEGLPVVRTLVRTLDRAVTGTSANPGGLLPAVTAAQAVAYFGKKLDLILDAGPCAGGPPSTIIDAGTSPLRLIRQGAIKQEELLALFPDLKI